MGHRGSCQPLRRQQAEGPLQPLLEEGPHRSREDGERIHEFIDVGEPRLERDRRGDVGGHDAIDGGGADGGGDGDMDDITEALDDEGGEGDGGEGGDQLLVEPVQVIRFRVG